MFNLFRRRPDPLATVQWPRLLRRMPLLSGLDADEKAKLEACMRVFLNTKSIQGAGGLEVDETMRLGIAAQACLPIMELDPKAYDDWNEVIVYPAAFIRSGDWTDDFGIVTEEREEILLGEARGDGPMVLSWEDAAHAPRLDGHNVVIHESAHKLDMKNGRPNGMPPLHRGMSRADWSRAFSHAYRDFCRRLDRGEHSEIDPYAAENPAEFFAVLSEYFFELPHLLADSYPEVYHQLSLFYRQDPRRRLQMLGYQASGWS
ncbi:M90 family metallopeptidase [Chitinimonas lacunae]|uniref:Zinc-dependent peptidase n=1 Tax=Chitinimonas lacunae TaxID=1963018 RepID=A0ABV8MVE3_9NEIS